MSSPSRILSPGFWLLGSFLCLSFATSMAVYKKGTSANLSKCLNASEHLMMKASESLSKCQEKFDCNMKSIYIPNPNNEDKILNACMRGQSEPRSCLFGENDAVDQTLCIETIYTILWSYEEKVRNSGSPGLLDAYNVMMQALKVDHKTIEEAPNKPSESYGNQLKQCKFLLTFQQHTNTIHRIMNFQMSLEQNAERKIILQGFF